MKKNIEAEIRSLITQNQYKQLFKFFKKEGKLLGEEKQISYYFSGKRDLRIQKTDSYAKIWLKKGQMHDDFREEVEIKIDIKDFEKTKKLFESLGYKVEIKWIRVRNIFSWDGIKVMLDNTKGYGYIIELEKICQESKKEKTVSMLRAMMNLLKVVETKKEEFDKKFEYYKKNWRRLTK